MRCCCLNSVENSAVTPNASYANAKVEVLKGARVAGYDGLFVTPANGEGIPAATLIWTAGVKPSPAIAALRRRKERGRLAVNEFQAVPEFPNVRAAGVCTAVLHAKTGTSHPPNAQHGLREGLIAAKNIEATILGKRMKPFPFTLRVLQEGQFEKLGEDRTRTVDVRIIAATNRDVAAEVQSRPLP